MSFLNIQNISYLSYIEQCFLQFKGVGTQLSAKEYDLIRVWQCAKIPRDVIISVFLERHEQVKEKEQSFPKSLLYFEKAVGEAFQAYNDKHVGSLDWTNDPI